MRAKHIQPFFRCQWRRWPQKPCFGGGSCKAVRRSGGEGGIRTLGTGVSPYNGLANSFHLCDRKDLLTTYTRARVPKSTPCDLIGQLKDTIRDTIKDKGQLTRTTP